LHIVRRLPSAREPLVCLRGSTIERVHAAAVRFDLHVPESRSLKTKRAAIRPIVDTLRHKYRVSVAEVDFQDQWQRAAIAVAVVAASDGHLRDVLANVERVVAHAPGVELLDVETAWLDPDEALPGSLVGGED
jgi:uncharacterized protein YlxP (DUF503 family)